MKKKKWSGDMVDRYLYPKFGINSFGGIRENDVYGRTTEARVMAVALLCSSTKRLCCAVAQSRAKKVLWRYGGRAPLTKIWH